MRKRIKSLIFAICCMVITSMAYSAGPPLEISQAQALGDGDVRVYGFVLGKYPVGMGFTFDARVFNNAPTAPSDGRWDILTEEGDIAWLCCGHELDFDAPTNIAAVTNFKHFVMNWNPHGHPPPHVYTVPHFDFHFYTQSRLDRTSIQPPAAEDMCNDNSYGIEVVPLDCAQLDKAMQPLPADQQPPSHTTVGAVEPGMGNHMVDLSSPEFSGQDFDHTFIFGTWEGNLTFWEPMISVDYLSSVRRSCHNIDNPTAAPEAGWYPGRYCISYSRIFQTYNITMTKFEWLSSSTD